LGRGRSGSELHALRGLSLALAAAAAAAAADMVIIEALLRNATGIGCVRGFRQA